MIISISSVWSHSRVRLFATLWTAAHQASLSITNSRSLLKLMSIESVMPSNHLILCRPLLPHLQSFSASGSFPMNQSFVRWPKYGDFSFNISPSNEHPGLISFRIDWFVLLAVQGTPLYMYMVYVHKFFSGFCIVIKSVLFCYERHTPI